MDIMPMVEGYCDEDFLAVKELFLSNFLTGEDENAQLCVYIGSEKIIDLYGCQNPSNIARYDHQSLQVVYSTGKSVVAVVIGLLVDQGLLDYDAKVAKYWPEFSKLGKENITVADVMRHESGLDHMDHVFVDDDFKRENIKNNCVGKWIENECPQWPNPVFNAHKGQTNLESCKRAYHSITRGWILNEIARRVDPKGRTIGLILHEEIISTGVHCGVPDEELNRVVPQQAKSTSWVLSQTLLPSFVTQSVIDMTLLDVYKSFTGNFEEMLRPLKCLKGVSTDVSVTHKHWQQDKFRSTEQPSSNFHASAKGLAWVAYIMANQGQDPSGKQILTKETWEKMHHDPKEAHDAVLGFRTAFTQGGFNHYRSYPNPNNAEAYSDQFGWYGWGGHGGSVMQWHPTLNISFAYAQTNIRWYEKVSKLPGRMQKAVVDCLVSRPIS